jgi:hypothetical protein
MEDKDSVFSQRDYMLETLTAGGYKMSPTAHALLWFLLFNLRRPDPADPWAFHVNIHKTATSVLKAATGRGDTAVREGLRELEANDFIVVTPRQRLDGSTTNPDIKMTSPLSFRETPL